MRFVNRIFNVSGQDLGLNMGHDVVVLKHDRKNRKSKVATITTLRGDNGKFRNNSLSLASKGDLIPVPVSVLGSRHWSGVRKDNSFVVSDFSLKKRRFCKSEFLSFPYTLLIR